MQKHRLHLSKINHACKTFLLLGLLSLALLTFAPWAFAVGWQPVGNVSRIAVLPDGVELTVGSAKVRVVAVSPNIVRVRYAPQGTFPPDHSFALVTADRKAPKVKVRDENDSVHVDTGEVRVAIRKARLRIALKLRQEQPSCRNIPIIRCRSTERPSGYGSPCRKMNTTSDPAIRADRSSIATNR